MFKKASTKGIGKPKMNNDGYAGADGVSDALNQPKLLAKESSQPPQEKPKPQKKLKPEEDADESSEPPQEKTKSSDPIRQNIPERYRKMLNLETNDVQCFLCRRWGHAFSGCEYRFYYPRSGGLPINEKYYEIVCACDRPIDPKTQTCGGRRCPPTSELHVRPKRVRQSSVTFNFDPKDIPLDMYPDYNPKPRPN